MRSGLNGVVNVSALSHRRSDREKRYGRCGIVNQERRGRNHGLSLSSHHRSAC